MAKCGGLCFFQLLLRAYAKQTRGAENVKSNFDVFLFSSYFSTFFIVLRVIGGEPFRDTSIPARAVSVWCCGAVIARSGASVGLLLGGV